MPGSLFVKILSIKYFKVKHFVHEAVVKGFCEKSREYCTSSSVAVCTNFWGLRLYTRCNVGYFF